MTLGEKGRHEMTSRGRESRAKPGGQSKRPKKETRVKDLSAHGNLRQEIKGGAVDAFIWFEQPKAK